MAALWLSGFMILLLSANSFGETGNPREFSTCSFSFEKRWEIIDDQDADWQGEKTDFFWGDVEISEAKGEWRVFEHVLSRNDYEDSKAYQATTRERVFSNGTITGSQHTSEGVLASTPGSTKDAVRAHRDLMASNQQAKTYYFDASPAEPFADLWQFHFLGYLPAEGPIWKINSKRVGDDFTFVDLRKNQVRYRLDPVSGLFHSATSINSGIRLDMTHVEQVAQTDL